MVSVVRNGRIRWGVFWCMKCVMICLVKVGVWFIIIGIVILINFFVVNFLWKFGWCCCLL